MIRSLYIILLISISLTACHEDSITIEESEIIIPPSEEVEVHQVEGLVKDISGTVLPQILVQLISSNEIIAESTSDQDGRFQFNDLFNDEEYLVVTQSDNYPITISSLDVEEEQVELLLLSNQENSFPFQVNNLDPATDEIVIFNGQLDQMAGLETGARIHILGEEFGWYNYGLLNDLSNFHIPIKKDESFDIYIENECGLNKLEGYGPYSISSPIEEIELAQEIANVTISGTVTDCEGQSIPNGDIIVSLDNGVSFQTNFIDGSYTIPVAGCNINEIFIVVIPLSQEPSFYNLIEITESSMTYDIEVCDPFMFNSYMNLIIDNEAIFLDDEFYAAEEWQGSYFVHSFLFSDSNSISFNLTPINGGNYLVNDLSIFTPNDFYLGNSEIEAMITFENESFIEGTIEGELFKNGTDVLEEFHIDFKLIKF